MSNLAADKHGTIVSHIAARGLHTNLLLQVAVTEDCRFAFAGVLRGSAQMLALDLSHLPTWSNYDRKSKLAVMRHVGVFAHQDAKLKGFGAATRLLEGGTNFAEYRLICGRGIKNMHIWSVAMAHEGSEPTWTLLYDAPTNGMTIELIGFRNFGTMAFSRSKGYGLRLWDLTKQAGAHAVISDQRRAKQQPLSRTSSTDSVDSTTAAATPAAPPPAEAEVPAAALTTPPTNTEDAGASDAGPGPQGDAKSS